MMSTTSEEATGVLESCRPADAEPVSLPVSALASTAPEYLYELKADLAAAGKVPAELLATARFDEDSSLATQEEIDRVRDYVRAAAFLGTVRLTLTVTEVAAPEKVDPALEACAERARREGVTFQVERP